MVVFACLYVCVCCAQVFRLLDSTSCVFDQSLFGAVGTFVLLEDRRHTDTSPQSVQPWQRNGQPLHGCSSDDGNSFHRAGKTMNTGTVVENGQVEYSGRTDCSGIVQNSPAGSEKRLISDGRAAGTGLGIERGRGRGRERGQEKGDIAVEPSRTLCVATTHLYWHPRG